MGVSKGIAIAEFTKWGRGAKVTPLWRKTTIECKMNQEYVSYPGKQKRLYLKDKKGTSHQCITEYGQTQVVGHPPAKSQEEITFLAATQAESAVQSLQG